ncbi:haloacid dehalogenase type II [Geodermatophilus sp. DSM 45219]|uniref:haloacid dehalogenase type II n=1 Tax=Geodermatophilus sp. DSM 45219 TaxID=1881103 RepID=UPI000884DE3D|nr:haloacid dehalogenase type II [Geodermatophilus sp. DSM 45219]SDO15123.1 2-haloacid dehalogenase [Geodermatophilus sp. DSM 45219]
MTAPQVVVFDVNETLSDMAPLAARFRDVGAPELTDRVWFASLLRDAFALTAAGGTERFATFATAGLRSILAGVPLTRELDAAVEHVMSGFTALDVHPDVPGGVRALKQSGRRLVTLSNGSAGVAERLLSTAGIRDEFEHLLSVEDAGVWKPAPGSYAYAARTCGVQPADMILVAVHPWDIDGANRAGLATAWINRDGRPYPEYFTAPTHTIAELPELADRLAA